MFNFDCRREECEQCRFYDVRQQMKGYTIIGCSHPEYSPDNAASWRARDHKCDHKEAADETN